MKNNISTIIFFVALSVIVSACQKQEVSSLSADDKAAIREVVGKAMVISNAQDRDFTTYAEHYFAEDATVMPPNVPAVTGRNKLISFFEEEPPYEEFQLNIEEIDGRGDLAYVRGTYQMSFKEGGTDAQDTGKYLEIWKKQDDRGWQVSLAAFNSNVSSAPEDSRKEQLEAFFVKLREAAEAGDIEAYTAHFVPEASMFLPNRPALVGRGRIGDWFDTFTARHAQNVDSYEQVDVDIRGNVALVRSRATGHYLVKSTGEEIPFEQKYVDVLRFDNEHGWRMTNHVASSSTFQPGVWDRDWKHESSISDPND